MVYSRYRCALNTWYLVFIRVHTTKKIEYAMIAMHAGFCEPTFADFGPTYQVVFLATRPGHVAYLCTTSMLSYLFWSTTLSMLFARGHETRQILLKTLNFLLPVCACPPHRLSVFTRGRLCSSSNGARLAGLPLVVYVYYVAPARRCRPRTLPQAAGTSSSRPLARPLSWDSRRRCWQRWTTQSCLSLAAVTRSMLTTRTYAPTSSSRECECTSYHFDCIHYRIRVYI